jgi:autotransporter-associated beta strand protein
LGTVNNGTTIQSGSTLQLNGFSLGTAEPLNLSGVGINPAPRGALLNSGSDCEYKGLITLGADTWITGSSGKINISHPGTITGSYNLLLLGAQGGTITSILGIGIGTLTKNDTGTWTLSGFNTYTGTTTITAGTLKLGNASALGGISSGTSITSGAVLDLNGMNYTNTEPLTVNGTGISSGGSVINSSTTGATFAGLITLGSTSSIVGGTGTINISNPGTITGATCGLTLGGSAGGTLASILGTTNGTLTKADAGTWTLSGANIYTGLTTINNGTLKLQTVAFSTTSRAYSIGSGAIMNIDGNTGVALGTTDISGTGTLRITGGNLYNSIGSGRYITMYLGSGSLIDVQSGATLTNGGWSDINWINNKADLNVDGKLDIWDGGTVFVDALTGLGTVDKGYNGGANSLTVGVDNGSGVFSGVIKNTLASLPLIKNGTGTQTLSGTNTYSGITTINAGNLKLDNASALGGTTSGTSITSGAVLDLNGTNYSNAEPLIVNGTGILGGGALLNSGSAATYSGLITLGSASSIVGGSGTINISNSGTITGATFGLTLGGAAGGTLASILGTTSGTLTKVDDGTWTLSGANTFTGGTTLNSGTLNINNNQALGTSAGTFTITGGTIDATTSGIFTVAYPLALNGDLTFAGTNSLNLGAGNVSMNGNRQITTTSNTLTIGGTFSAGSYNLSKAGSGTLSFGSNAVTVKDLTISAGTLISTSGTLSLAGDFTNNGTFTHNTGTITFNGTSTIGGSSVTSFNNLTVTGTLTGHSAANMNVAGNWTNNGTFTHNWGTVSLNGTTQHLGGTSGTTFNNLIVTNSSATDLNGTDSGILTTVAGDLTISSGSLTINPTSRLTVSGTLANSVAERLVLKSDAAGTASLIHNTTDVPATVERYIAGAAEAWHFLSSPVAAQEIIGSWIPSGTYGNGIGYDLYLWDEPTKCWKYKLNSNWSTLNGGTGFVPGRGYLYSLQATTPTKSFSGLLNNGSISYNLTFTNDTNRLKGFNLVGNPYPSSIDWQASGWTRTNLETSGSGYHMWIWNPTANNYGVVHSDSVVTGTNGVTRYIAPMQGFFVRATGEGSLIMTNTVRTHTGANAWKSAQFNPGAISAVVTSETDQTFDEVQMLFGYPTNQTGAAKLFSPVATAPSLYLPVGDANFTVRYLTDTLACPAVPVQFKPGRNDDYTLSFNFDESTFKTVLLEDRPLKVLHDLRSDPTYRFRAATTDQVNRFILHLTPVRELTREELPARIFTDGEKILIDLMAVTGETTVCVYDLLGRKRYDRRLTGETQHTLNFNPGTQPLIIQLKNPQGSLCRKILCNNTSQ